MSVRSVRVEPDPVLRAPARPVQEFSGETARLVKDLIETMHANDGIGIAAPQIGASVQVFVANPSQRRGCELVVINPVVDEARGRAGVVEGCLSVPDVWDRVTRAAAVHLHAQDVCGKPLELQAEGLLAIVLQHELDHLKGRLFIDRVPWFRRWRLWGKLRRPACA